MGIKQRLDFTDLLVRYMKLEEEIPWAFYLGSACLVLFGISLLQSEINLISSGIFYYISKSLSAAIVGVGLLIFVLTATRTR